METIKASEQDIINSICMLVSNKKQVDIHEVEVELFWDEQYGFSAEAIVEGREQVLVEANLIEALRFWIEHHLEEDPFATGIELKLEEEEGIVAYLRL